MNFVVCMYVCMYFWIILLQHCGTVVQLVYVGMVSKSLPLKKLLIEELIEELHHVTITLHCRFSAQAQ